MKRVTFTALLLAFAFCIHSQTANKLIEKYKSLPNATYTLTNVNYDKNNAKLSFPPTDGWNNVKLMEVVVLPCNDDLQKTISNELKELDGYSVSMSVINNIDCTNGFIIEDGKPKLHVLGSVLPPDAKFNLLYKGKEEDAADVIGAISSLQTTILIHLEGKINIDDIPKMFDIKLMKFDTFDEKDYDPSINYDEYWEKANKSCTIVIDGKYMPNLHNLEEAIKYGNDNNLKIVDYHLIVGKEKVRAKYPKVDADFIVLMRTMEYVSTPKEL